MEILVADIGGIGVKLHLQGQKPCSFSTPAGMTPEQFMQGISGHTANWAYDHVSLGFPGPVKHNHPVREPVNLGGGWVDFDFTAAFNCPVRMMNDAAMQALGSYHDDVMLFLGLGTGLGTALIHDGHVVSMEMAHMPFRDGHTFEHCLGKAGLDAYGIERWKQDVLEAVELFTYALYPDEVVLGGGNAQRFSEEELPAHVRLGDNSHAFTGGLRMWEAVT